MHTAKSERYNAGPFSNDDENKKVLIKAEDVDSYFTENYYTCFTLWDLFHKGLGFPFQGGWAEQPKWMVDIIYIFENEYIAFENERSKEVSDKGKGGKPKLIDDEKKKLLSQS